MLTSDNQKFSVVIPNRFEDIIQPLLKSFKQFEPNLSRVVIVADNHSRSYGHDLVKATGQFIFSRSVNLGIKYASPDDIILMNDDVKLLQSNTFETLRSIAYGDPEIGIISPQVDGGCGNPFMRPSHIELWAKGRKSIIDGVHYCSGLSGDKLTFACVYMKRECLDSIGSFDESFVDYGFDDSDVCIRTIKAGWKLAVTNKIVVRHGEGGEKFIRGRNWSSSFARLRGANPRANLKRLYEKHGVHPNFGRS